MSWIEKLKGDAAAIHPRASNKIIALAWLGSCIAIAVIIGLQISLGFILLLSSLGASSCLVFGFPDVAFAQPRNVICGHFFTSLTGLIFLTLFGDHWWALSMAVGTGIAIMMFTRTVHPPAGSNPIVVFTLKQTWIFLFFPTLFGACFLVGVGLIYNNITRKEKYPKYW